MGGSDAPGLSILTVTWLNFMRNGEALIQKVTVSFYHYVCARFGTTQTLDHVVSRFDLQDRAFRPLASHRFRLEDARRAQESTRQ